MFKVSKAYLLPVSDYIVYYLFETVIADCILVVYQQIEYIKDKILNILKHTMVIKKHFMKHIQTIHNLL